MIDKFSAEFATEPPRQPASAWLACRQDDGELTGKVDVFRDGPDPSVRDVGDQAIAWQRTNPELDLRAASAWATFALSSIR